MFVPTSVAVLPAPATGTDFTELLVATNSKIYKYPLPIKEPWQQVPPIVVRESGSRIRGLVVIPGPGDGDGGADARSVISLALLMRSIYTYSHPHLRTDDLQPDANLPERNKPNAARRDPRTSRRICWAEPQQHEIQCASAGGTRRSSVTNGFDIQGAAWPR